MAMPGTWIRGSLVGAAAAVVLVALSGSSAASIESKDTIAAALDLGPYVSATLGADSSSVLVSSTTIGSFPRAGGSYLILSTGDASAVVGGSPGEFISTDLPFANQGADGNDLTSVRFEVTPPAAATCMAFDFQFMSEEYPEYIGVQFNDIFTAELNESEFFMSAGSQVAAPNNFAYDTDGNFISVNTVLGFAPATGTRMDGSTEALVAVSKIEKNNAGNATLILSIQDVGDSVYDSAVLLDNFRWLYGNNCDRGVSSLTDTDGDGLPDSWETDGVDYDGDGIPELDLAALGADPERADIFLEIDWMVEPQTCLNLLCWGGQSVVPSAQALQDVVDAFATAPHPNPDGSNGITLHIDAGPDSTTADGGTWDSQGGGNSVAWDPNLGVYEVAGGASVYNWSEFDAIKADNFDSVRWDVFHYVIYGERQGASGSSGLSRGLPGSDLMVMQGNLTGPTNAFSRVQERGTLMHELGHNLSLKHGGPNDTEFQWDATYQSIMNYAYQLEGITPTERLDYSRGAPHDDWANIRFDGGSVGDLGDAAPPLVLSEDVDELTREIAEAFDVLAADGDGAISHIGPNVMLLSQPGQSVVVEVSNLGNTDAEFAIVTSTWDGTLLGSQRQTIAADATESVTLNIESALIQIDSAPLVIKLTSLDLGFSVDEVRAYITLIDPLDSQSMAALAADLELARGMAPGDGPGDAFLASLEGSLNGVVDPELDVGDSDSSSSKSPDDTAGNRTLVIAIGSVVVLAMIAFAWAMTRKPKN